MPRATSKKLEQPYRQLRNTDNILALYHPDSSATGLARMDAEFASADRSDVISLALSDIYVDPNRVRRDFDPDTLQSLAESMKAHGFVGAIVVRPNQGSDPLPPYRLVAGGRRYRAAQLAGLDSLRAIVADLTDEQALEFELIENLQRQDLNPLEETKGILQLLSSRLQLAEAEVIALFQRHAYLQNIDIHKRSSTEPDPQFQQQWQTVESLFSVIGKFTPNSFRVNRLPLLNLPDPIRVAVDQGQLEYSKARLVARVKDEAKQYELLQQAVEQGLSQAQIQEAVRQHNQAPTPNSEASQTQISQIQARVLDVAKTLKRAKFLTSLSKRDRAKVEKLLEQLWEMTVQQTD